MKTTFFYNYQFLFPLIFLLIGLSVLVRKKPLIINYRWFFLLMIIIILPTFQIISFSSIGVGSILPILFIGYFYYFMRGFMILGANGDDLQKAFMSVLAEGNYEFEQTFTSIKIKEPALEMSIAFQSWIGTGQIRIKNKADKETFYKIMNQLKNKEIKTNLIMPIFYILFGLIMLYMDLFII
ncbi:MAG: hypothetical protein WCO54_02800 [Bacteroidota bacterium]